MKSTQVPKFKIKFRLDNPVCIPLETKAPYTLAIRPAKLFRMLQAAIIGQLKLVNILTSSEPQQHWKKLHDKLSIEEKTQCENLQERSNKLDEVINEFNSKMGPYEPDYSKWHYETRDNHIDNYIIKNFDPLCQELAKVISDFPKEEKKEEKQEFKHIEMDSNRWTVLITNLFAARQYLLSKDKEQKSTRSSFDFERFFQNPTPQKQGPYTIPDKMHQFWDGSKYPNKYFHNTLNLAKRANKCKMNLWSFDNNVCGGALVPTGTRQRFLDLAASPRFRIRNIAEEFYPKIKKIFQPEIARQIISIFELERNGNKNYAAESDLFRYLILLIEGGWYSDTDMKVENQKYDLGHLQQIEYEEYDGNEYKVHQSGILTEKENEALKRGFDPDFRSFVQPNDEKQGIAFDTVVKKIREELFIAPVEKIKKYFNQSELKDIENTFGNDVWEKMEDAEENYSPYRNIFIAKFFQKFIKNFLKTSNNHPAFPKLKEALKKVKYNHNKIYTSDDSYELKRFIDCLNEWDRLHEGLIPDWKSYQINDWIKIFSSLNSLNYSIQQPSENVGIYYEKTEHGTNTCFLGASPHHHDLYDAVLSYIERFQILQYQTPLDVVECEIANMDPSKVARITHYTMMDTKRSPRSLVYDDPTGWYNGCYERTPLRKELVVHHGVSTLTANLNYYAQGVNIHTLFRLKHTSDGTWLENKSEKKSEKTTVKKIYSFDTADCRYKSVKNQGKGTYLGLSL